MEKKDKIAMLEQSLDRKLTTLEMYETARASGFCTL